MAEAKQFDLEAVSAPNFMDCPFLVEGSLQNRRIGDACTGYSFEITSFGYRGIWVSTIEDVTLKVDGEEIPKDQIILSVNGKKFLAPQLSELFAEFWHPLERAKIIVYKVGGLAPGEHEVEMSIRRHNDFGYSHEFAACTGTHARKFTIEA